MSVSRDQLARLAELRIWDTILSANETVNGLDPDSVLRHAQNRADRLSRQLFSLSPREQEEALDGAPRRERDRAFGEAALAMKQTLSMIHDEAQVAK